ncbi:MAG: ATP-binding protein [Thermomicrobiales bacterium]
MAAPVSSFSSLVGREREQSVLRAHLAAALAGRGSLVLIGGEAGIGKTALVETLCQDATARGALVLVGHCFDLTETPPYGPFVELFGRYAPRAGWPALPAAFAERGTVGAVSSQAALFQQVHGFLSALATQTPVILFLDDLHWADLASLDLLRFLARTLATLPVLLVVTYRTDELTRRHPLYHLLPLLVREAHADRLDLQRIEEHDIRALIIARYQLPVAERKRLVVYLHQRSEGNPFFLGELLRTLEGERVLRQRGAGWTLGDLTQTRVPMLLRQMIDGRLARLDEEAQRLLAVAAVIGQEVPLTLWTAVAERDEETLLTAAEQAADAHLIMASRDGMSIQFAHALIREALYEGILPMRRRIWHRRAGETLAAEQSPDPDAVAHHFRTAGDLRAYEWLIRAGDRAQHAYAYVVAADRFDAALAIAEERGIDERERAWLLMRLAAMVEYTTPARSVRLITEAARLAERAGERRLAAYALLQRGFEMGQSGDPRGVALVEAGSAALEALTEQERAQLLTDAAHYLVPNVVADGHAMLAYFYGSIGRIADAVRVGEPLLGGDTTNLTYIGLAEAYTSLGMPERSRAMHERARVYSITRGNHTNVAYIETRLLDLVLQYDTDNLAERQRAMEAAMAAGVLASRTRPAPPRIYSLALLFLEGQWDAVRQVAAAMVAGEDVPSFLRHHARLALLRVWAETGEWEQAWGMIREWLPEGPMAALGSIVVRSVVPLQQVAAQLAFAVTDLATAKEWLTAHDRWLAWSGAVLGQSEGQALWAQYHRQSGAISHATAHAQRALAHASDPRQPLALLAAHRLLGELATDAGKHADAAMHLKQSLALTDACAAPFERALTLLAFAALHIATGERADAQSCLDEVRATCIPLDARPTLARADTLAARLTAIKQTPPTTQPVCPGGKSRCCG